MAACIYNIGQSMVITAAQVLGTNTGVVWTLWDGTTQTSPPGEAPQIEVILNRSGDCTVTATAVDDLGRSSSSSFSFYVNTPPVVTNVALSDNYDTFPFVAAITASATDPDGDTDNITWTLYTLDTAGNQQSLLGSVPSPTGGSFTANIVVSQAQTVYLQALDEDGGTNTVSFDLSGTNPANVSPNPLPMTINPDGGQVVGDAYITASVVVADTSEPTSFAWTFWGVSSGDPGTTEEISPGIWCNTIRRSTSDAPAGGGRQTVTCTVTFSDSSFTSPPVSGTILLYSALPPVLQEVANVNPDTGFVVAGNPVVFTTSAVPATDVTTPSDPDGAVARGGDTIFYTWTITLPINTTMEYITIASGFPESGSVTTEETLSGEWSFANQTIMMLGASVTVPTTGMNPGDVITASCSVTSNLGGEVVTSPPSVTIQSATALAAVSLTS